MVCLRRVNTVLKFLTRCYKPDYMFFELVEKSDLAMANRIRKQPSHPLFIHSPRFKERSLNLRNPRTEKFAASLKYSERYKSSFLNRLHFQFAL